MESLLATPVQPLEVMIGKLAPFVIVGMIQTAVILGVARLLFGVPMAGGWLALVLGVLLFIIGSPRPRLPHLHPGPHPAAGDADLGSSTCCPRSCCRASCSRSAACRNGRNGSARSIPVTHFLRVVRGALLKGQGFADMVPSLLALAIFVCAVAALALLRYRTTLD